MPSSISNFEAPPASSARRTPTKALIAATIAGAVLLVAVLELGIRYGFGRVSRIESRTMQEYRQAGAIRRQPGVTTILLVGNSLLLEGVDMPLLSKSLGGNVRLHRLGIEGTALIDWQYGVRRLFEEGSRPDMIVVMMGASQILPSQIRGDYSAYYLFRTRDIPEIAKTAGYDLTKESSLFFARYSLLFAGRNNLRNFTLNTLDRSYGDVLHQLAVRPEGVQNQALVAQAARERLGDMLRTCMAEGARIAFTIAPGFFKDDATGAMEGARSAGVPVLDAVAQGEFDLSLFRDGFHLSTHGAETFTTLFASRLKEIVR